MIRKLRSELSLRVKKVLTRTGLQSRFVQHVLTLMTGTGLAQIITILAAPLLTRLFTPDDYGVLALYTTVAGLYSVFATGMYFRAIMVAQDEAEAANLFSLSAILTIGTTLLTFAIISLFHESIVFYLDAPSDSFWLYLVPISVFLSGFRQITDYWLNRKQGYEALATAQIGGTVVSTSSNISLGLAQTGAGGLIAGYLLSQSAFTAFLFWFGWRKDRFSYLLGSWWGMTAAARRHKQFPLFVLPTEWVSVANNRMPILFLIAFSTTSSIGFYELAVRVIALPMSLLASSIGAVFKERASRDYIQYGNCRDIYVKTLRSLVLLAVVPFATLFISAPYLFAFAFGEPWREAGEYTRWLSVMYFFSFISAPLGYVYYMADKQQEYFWLQIYAALSTFGAMYLGYTLYQEPRYIVAFFSANYILIYIIAMSRSYYFSKGVAR